MCNFIGIAFITKMCKENAQRAIFTAMALRQYKKYNNCFTLWRAHANTASAK